MNDEYETKSIINGLNLIKNNNEISFNVDWWAYKNKSI